MERKEIFENIATIKPWNRDWTIEPQGIYVKDILKLDLLPDDILSPDVDNYGNEYELNEMVVFRRRLETDQEMNDRYEKEDKYKKIQSAREYEQYIELKKKFE